MIVDPGCTLKVTLHLVWVYFYAQSCYQSGFKAGLWSRRERKQTWTGSSYSDDVDSVLEMGSEIPVGRGRSGWVSKLEA